MSEIKNPSFDVIITTYCRVENIVILANEILSITPSPNQLIIVDTSPQINENLKVNPRIRYIRSSLNHQNQPYKRMVGALAAKSDKIVFFDDDIEILDEQLFAKILPLLDDENVVGLTCDIDFQEVYSEPNVYRKAISNGLLFLTGKPLLRPGKMSLAGYHGTPRKDMVSDVEALSGPFMAFNRELFLKLPDIEMLSLFDQQLIIPEDKLLSIKANRLGRLLYYPEKLIKHPKIQSTYFLNIRDHTKRVHFSRFILNRELSKGKFLIVSHLYDIHFWYYSFWRLLLAFLNCIWNAKNYFPKLLGIMDALDLSCKFLKGNIKMVTNLLEDGKKDAEL